MIDKEFIAHLSSTQADVRILNAKVVDAKQIKLKDKNILDYIKESEFNSYDTRDPQLKNDELDIWNTEISLSENGHIEVKPLEHSVTYDDETSEEYYEGVTETQVNTLRTGIKIINNDVLGENDEHIMYWQSNGLTDGGILFGLSELTTFLSDLSNLTDGPFMFDNCYNLTHFSSDLSNLLGGYWMFCGCSSLVTFTSDMPSLGWSTHMFIGCENLTHFSSNLSNLIDGSGMFEGCPSLTSFSSNLTKLNDGYYMFNCCKLDAPSVANIIHSLPVNEMNGEITIGIGCDATAEDQLLFAQECDCDTWQELLDDFSAKNWTVEFELNGRPTTTYNMRRVETLPIYTKLEEVIMPTDEKERKPHYTYTSVDGSKFYNIRHFHSTNGSTEGYDIFSSLEEAISTYNVTPKN